MKIHQLKCFVSPDSVLKLEVTFLSSTFSGRLVKYA